MYFKVKVKEVWTRTVMLHADTEEVARRKAADGYGQGLAFPTRDTETEILETEQLDLFEDPPFSKSA